MPRRIIRARRTVSRRIGIGVIVLTTVSVVIFTAIVWMFIGLNERQKVILESVREDAVWAAYQTEREAERLLHALADDRSVEGKANITRRFDLLYSRAALISQGAYAAVFEQGKMGAISEELHGLIGTMATIVDGQDEGKSATLQAPLERFQVLAAELLVAANAAGAERRVSERRELRDTYWRIGVGVSALTIALVLIVILLGLQLIHSSRTGREIELLSRRNARVARKASAASEAKSAFLATMSHEIRTPLNGILGVADLLQDTPLSGDQLRQVDIIRQSGTMLLDVINDILDFSKLESGAVRFEPSPVALSATFNVVTDMMRRRAGAAGLTFHVSYSDYLLHADANRIRQVLVNLVGNAIKFTEKGQVSLDAKVEDDRLRVEVSDTGPGIAADAIPLLFRDFTQLDNSSTRSFGGTGLGLAICKRLVDLMGGTIGVDSTPGQGSTFWFELPVGPVAKLDMAEDRVLATPPHAFSGRVLVVDDNATNREVSARLLQRLGAETVVAVDGAEALEIVGQTGFDLILMDMQMPKLDGLSATRRLREQGYTRPVVGLTANAYDSDRTACLDAGMNGHVAKPVTRQKLIDLLLHYLPEASPGEPDGLADQVDVQQQRSLIEEIGQETFDDLVAQFRSDMQALLADAHLASEARDAAGYDRALHTLKGAAQTLGMTTIAHMAQTARNQPDRLEALLERAACNPVSTYSVAKAS